MTGPSSWSSIYTSYSLNLKAKLLKASHQIYLHQDAVIISNIIKIGCFKCRKRKEAPINMVILLQSNCNIQKNTSVMSVDTIVYWSNIMSGSASRGDRRGRPEIRNPPISGSKDHRGVPVTARQVQNPKNLFLDTFSTIFWGITQVWPHEWSGKCVFRMYFYYPENIELREQLRKIDGKGWKSCLKVWKYRKCQILY